MHVLWFPSLAFLAVYLATPLTATPTVLRSLDIAPVVHFTLTRRGGKFPPTEVGHDHVDLGYLSQQLERTEARFNLTQRQVAGNKLVRKAKGAPAGSGNEGDLMGDVAAEGTWYAQLKIGNPPQQIEMDLNMLVSDFHIMITTSRKGSKYDDYFSRTVVQSLDRPYPTCLQPTDEFHLPTVNISVPLSFAYCRPSKYSLHTLGPSGSTLGLAPSKYLSQTRSTPLMTQLLEAGVIQRPVFSLTVLNGEDGVLSLGGTAASAVKMVEAKTKSELDSLGGSEVHEPTDVENPPPPLAMKKRGRSKADIAISPRQPDWDEGWTWSEVQGAEGWWQTLVRGVWVDGSKILDNQAVVIDINSPFILAPPLAAKAFYASISGSRPLPPPYSNFYVYPCLNPPNLQFAFGNTKFPFMRGGRGSEWPAIPGGKFSLGKLKPGSGYCIGAVVETRMGVREERDETVHDRKRGSSTSNRGGLGGNGMRDVWVIGEGFFRGIGGAFDFKEKRVGFRVY